MLMAAKAGGARQDHRKPSAASAQPNDASQAAIVRFRGDRTMLRQIGQSQAVGYRERPMCPAHGPIRIARVIGLATEYAAMAARVALSPMMTVLIRGRVRAPSAQLRCKIKAARCGAVG
jgi:hypothetical protein